MKAGVTRKQQQHEKRKCAPSFPLVAQVCEQAGFVHQHLFPLLLESRNDK